MHPTFETWRKRYKKLKVTGSEVACLPSIAPGVALGLLCFFLPLGVPSSGLQGSLPLRIATLTGPGSLSVQSFYFPDC